MILLIISIALCMILIEKAWPSNELPIVHNWWTRIIFINFIQMLIIILAGYSWDLWFKEYSIINLRNKFSYPAQAIIAYFISTFIYYWWHRIRHESKLFWLLCHQLHHSPRRIEILTSFFKHPVEILLNSWISGVLVYFILGCSIEAGAVYTILTAIAEFFYHWNIKTPHFIGYFIQRPESHRIHHKFQHHTQNFADLPIWDMLFGTFFNPKEKILKCGYTELREDRFEDMLMLKDVNSKRSDQEAPISFLPTCIGCKKRWACKQELE